MIGREKSQDARWAPNQTIRAWLREPSGSAGEGGDPPDWAGLVHRKLAGDRALWLGKVLVDRDVLEQRFACVSERCAPGPGRGKWRSCCADVEVQLGHSEVRRLKAWSRGHGRDEIGSGIDPSGHALARSCGRCAHSKLDGQGRIRCRLRGLAARAGLEQSELQPLSCRLFPLIVVDLGERRTLLTLVSRFTARMTGHLPPARYPCLNDPELPPLVRSMRSDLDWLFGAGIARALADRSRR